MSIEYCHRCQKSIDTDYDVEHFSFAGRCVVDPEEFPCIECRKCGDRFPMEDRMRATGGPDFCPSCRSIDSMVGLDEEGEEI